MKYQVGDLFMTKNFGQNVIHTIVKIENGDIWTEWYNQYSQERTKTRYSINNISHYTHWIHYKVKQ